jgi:hypothetical protein
MQFDGSIMLKTLTTFILILATTACANKSIPKDLLNKDLIKEAQPLYTTCLADYKKTMSENEAKKACTEKLKASYKKITKK